jgi:hypothetical protein
MLSTTKYASLCVLGVEVFYVLCLVYEFFLPQKGRELHRALFELLPGFVWGNILSMVWGAVFLAIAAWITGSYIAWMHNKSLISSETRNRAKFKRQKGGSYEEGIYSGSIINGSRVCSSPGPGAKRDANEG